jgi:LytR cell envelope-related transcriptional attenuator/cell envelope-related transcriptional attenuator-like protein
VKADRPRLRNPKTLAAATLALALLAAAVYVARPNPGNRDHPRVAGSLGASPPSVVWMIPTPHGDQIAIVGLPKSGPAVAIAVPSDSHVILPAGDISTVGASANTGPHAQAVAQNVLLRRVGHYLVTTPANFGKLVDALGGIQVQTEAPFTFNGHRIQPGGITMKGAMAVAYLAQADDNDVTGRWEDLLAGVLDAAHESSAWGTVGDSDDPVVVSRLLAASTGATVLEMPTEPASGGGIEADRNALTKTLPRFGQSLGSLVRIVVVNGSGAPGLGTLIDGKLAPYGFTVLTSQNASHFNVKHTTVVASGEKNLAAAQVAAKMLGVKSVKVSDQPTSLADVTIVAGKDFHG